MNQDTLNQMLYFGPGFIPGEIWTSLFAIIIIAILAIVIAIVFRHQDPTKPDKNYFIMIVETLIEKVENFVVSLMGERWRWFSGYILGLGAYMVVCFILSLIGFPAPFSYLGSTLGIALVTFVMIHVTAMKVNKWKYYQRYLDPLPIFLPINLISMWAPLLSLAFRLFGNVLAGFTLMSIVYYFLGAASNAIFGGIIGGPAASIILPPFVTPVLHAYFDVFSGAVQTMIFTMLTMLFIAQEDPDEEVEDIEKASSLKA